MSIEKLLTNFEVALEDYKSYTIIRKLFFIKMLYIM